MSATRTAFRTCPLCEAGCGLEITLRREDDGSESVQRIRGDMQDVFSQGFLCPKGSTLGHLHDGNVEVKLPADCGYFEADVTGSYDDEPFAGCKIVAQAIDVFDAAQVVNAA